MQQCSLGKAGTHVVVRVAKKCSAIVAIICKHSISALATIAEDVSSISIIAMFITPEYMHLGFLIPRCRNAGTRNATQRLFQIQVRVRIQEYHDKEIVGKTIRNNFESPPNQVNVYNGLLQFFLKDKDNDNDFIFI